MLEMRWNIENRSWLHHLLIVYSIKINIKIIVFCIQKIYGSTYYAMPNDVRIKHSLAPTWKAATVITSKENYVI